MPVKGTELPNAENEQEVNFPLNSARVLTGFSAADPLPFMLRQVGLTLGDRMASGVSTTTYTTSPRSEGSHTFNGISYQATGENRP